MKKNLFLLIFLMLIAGLAVVSAQNTTTTIDEKPVYELYKEIPFPEDVQNLYNKRLATPGLNSIVFSPPTKNNAGFPLYVSISDLTFHSEEITKLYFFNKKTYDFYCEKHNLVYELSAGNLIVSDGHNEYWKDGSGFYDYISENFYVYLLNDYIYEKKEIFVPIVDSIHFDIPAVVFSDGTVMRNSDYGCDKEFEYAYLTTLDSKNVTRKINPGFDLSKLDESAKKVNPKYSKDDILYAGEGTRTPGFSTAITFNQERIIFHINDTYGDTDSLIPLNLTKFSSGEGLIIYDREFNKLGEIEFSSEYHNREISPYGNYIKFSADKTYLSDDHGNIIIDFERDNIPCSYLEWSAGEDMLLSSGYYLLNMKTMKEVKVPGSPRLRAVADAETGLVLATVSAEYRIINYNTGENHLAFKDFKPDFIQISGDGNEIIGYNNKLIRIYRRAGK